MKQVLVNLLSNAVKFTPSGGRILLEASVIGTAGAPGAPGVEGAEGVVIQVTDTGFGLAAEHPDKAMSTFGPVHEALNRETHGTGLGLPNGRAHVRTPATNAHIVCQRPLDKTHTLTHTSHIR